VARGFSQSCISIFSTESDDIDTIEYHDPDIDVTCDNGLFVEARNPAGTTNPADGPINAISNFRIYGGRIRCSSTGGVIRGAVAKIYGTEIIGLNGPGLELANNAIVELHAPRLTGMRPVGGGSAAFGLAINGSGTFKWHGGGSILASGPVASSMAINNIAAVEFFGTPEFFPTLGDIDLVITNKMYSKPFSDWIVETTGQNYYATFDLSTLPGGGVTDIAKTIFSPTLEIPFPGGAVGSGFSFSLEVLWINRQQVRVYIITTATLTGCNLKARLTEFA
jgi:hypothetical protein